MQQTRAGRAHDGRAGDGETTVQIPAAAPIPPAEVPVTLPAGNAQTVVAPLTVGVGVNILADEDSSDSDEAPTPALMCVREHGFSPGIKLERSPRSSPYHAVLTPQLPSPKKSVAPVGLVGLLSLGLLVLQNTAISLTMRASRLPGSNPKMYLATSAVFMSEFIKFVSSFIFLVAEKNGLRGALHAMHTDILSSLSSNLLLLVPSALYTLQNNLQYFAASNLDPATFQVLYQMKLITTAILSVMMLGRELSYTQWVSVLVLTAGIAVVQTDKMSDTSSGKGHIPRESQVAGFVAVLVACCTSAGAGVFLEKLVKQTTPSVWIRNIQLASFGMIVSAFACYAKDANAITTYGFLQGFDAIVWVVVLLQSCGGILVAVVLKYADNIIKGFATGLSIILTGAISVMLFDVTLSPQYVVGAAVVVTSVYLYSANAPPPCCDFWKRNSDMGTFKLQP